MAICRCAGIAGLQLIVDALLRDYSSSAGDLTLLHRAIYLHQEDSAAYLLDKREMYYGMGAYHCWFNSTPNELYEFIEDTNPGNALTNCEAILRVY